jgi:hypothetical protein
MNRRTIALFTVLVAVSSVLSACATSAPRTTASSNSYEWTRGKLSFTTPHTLGECHDATIAAFTDLGVPVTGDTTDRTGGRIVAKTAVGDPVTVDIEPQTFYVTTMGIRVGLWGNEVQARQIAEAIARQIP